MPHLSRRPDSGSDTTQAPGDLSLHWHARRSHRAQSRRGALRGLGADGDCRIPGEPCRRYSPCFGDSGARPAAGGASEHLGQLAFRERIAGLGAQPVRGHRGVIDGVGFRYRLVRLPAGGDGRRPGDLSRRLPCLVWCVALAPAGELGAGGCGLSRTRCSAAGRGFAEVPGRRPVFCCPGRADEPDQELILWGSGPVQMGRLHRSSW